MMKAIFLDRDGTIIRDKIYLADPALIEWMPGAIEGLKKLKTKGYDLFLITNQSGLGRGYFKLENLQQVHQRLEYLMLEAGIGKFSGIEFCPHAPQEQCHCRKPNSLMLERIFNQYKIDKSVSWMIGDKDIDALCGKNAGVQSAIIGSEYQDWAKQNKFSYFRDIEQFADSLERK